MKIGALLRAYALTPENLPGLQSGLALAYNRLRDAGITEITIGVWTDKGNPAADCGVTFPALKKQFAHDPSVTVYQTRHGDAFVDILNVGLRVHRARGVTHSLILSWETYAYIDVALVHEMRSRIVRGAKAVAVALPDIAEFVSEGAIMNTLALWDTEELLGVGGFDPKDRKPREMDHYAGSNAGVGEFIPLLKMCERLRKPLLAVVEPTVVGSVDIPLERLELHKKKIASKRTRIEGMLREIGRTSDDLAACIMR